MWFLDRRADTSLFAAGQRPEPIPLEEWLLANLLEGAAVRLRTQLKVADVATGSAS